LLRNLSITRPDQVWARDITYNPLQHGFLSLTTMMDLYNRNVLSWWLSNTLTGDFSLEALDAALAGTRPEICDTDHRAQFTATATRALGIGAEVVRDALHLHKTGKRPLSRVDGRRRQRRQPGQPFEPKYRQIAAEVDRRRKAGEGFDRLAHEMKVSRCTVLRAYDFANRDEAAAAAREGRKPTRPPYTWSDESRAAKPKPRGA